MLVDTSAWIEFLRATHSQADRSVTALLADGAALFTAGIILQEVLQGCRDDHHAAEVRGLLLSCHMLEPVSPETFDHAAALYRHCRKKGRQVRGAVDCLIAALAIEHRLPLLAHDRDFAVLERYCGLVLYPSGG